MKVWLREVSIERKRRQVDGNREGGKEGKADREKYIGKEGKVD